MSFAIRNLSVLAYAQGFTLWHYRATTTSLEAVRAPEFFDAAQPSIAAGDMILVTARDGGTVLFVGTSSEAAGVRVGALA